MAYKACASVIDYQNTYMLQHMAPHSVTGSQAMHQVRQIVAFLCCQTDDI